MRAASLLLLGLLVPGQDPAPKPTDFTELARRAAGAGAAALEALERLPVEVAIDYAAAHAAWRQLPAGKARTILGNVLDLQLLDEADVVVSGSVERVEADQGGVIDHHTVWLTFGGGLTVHRAPPGLARELAQSRTFAVLRGTSRDAWLAAVLVRHLRSTAGAHTFAFRRRDLQHAGTEPVGRSLQFHECHCLPAAAGRVAVGTQR
jgi:hypothetical protein